MAHSWQPGEPRTICSPPSAVGALRWQHQHTISDTGGWTHAAGNAGSMILCYCWSKTALTSRKPTATVVMREACPGCGLHRY